MGSSWSEFASSCKSRLSAIARSCYLGREHWVEKYRQAKVALEESRIAMAICESRCLQLEHEKQDLLQRISDLEAERTKTCPIQLPLGDVPPGQQYGANTVALSVNLARKLGIRRSQRAQKIF